MERRKKKGRKEGKLEGGKESTTKERYEKERRKGKYV